MRSISEAARTTTREGLQAAVHRHKAVSPAGFSERLFTLVFRGLVYPQIWEDPEADLQALALEPTHRLITIASGGCNALSYLAAQPAEVIAVDLNGAHIALGNLKQTAIKRLDYAGFRRFFAEADAAENVAVYDSKLRLRLDAATSAYWESRDRLGRRRIGAFSRNFYRYGLLGYFVRAAHWLAHAYGVDPKAILCAKTLEEQKAIYAKDFAPLLNKRLVRWLTAQQASLFGLGIPPAQYDALAADSGEGMIGSLGARLERLACGFPIKQNYFAWQAFGGGYERAADAALPPYLQADKFETLRRRADDIRFVHGSLTAWLEDAAAASLDRFVLLDAQDWMSDADLTTLWAQITRTSRGGARVVFRTAAAERLLPGRVPDAILSEWRYDEALSREGLANDRSAIYGGFHVYKKAGANA